MKKAPNTFVEYGIDRENHKNKRIFGVSTEINNPDGSEYRVYGKVPIKICEVYLRIWIGKLVICFGSGSFSMRIKDKSRFKLVWGLSGTPKNEITDTQTHTDKVLDDNQRKDKKMLKIAVCGLDGIGKTTLIEKLEEKLIKDGLTVVQTKVPFTCKTLMENIGHEALSEFEIVRRIGMTFEFAEHYNKIDAAADVLICDRYDIDFEVLNDTYNVPQNYKDIMHAIYMQVPRLDLCFYLQAGYSVAVERLNKRGNRKDYESDDILISMQNSFDKRIKEYPNSVILDATKTEDEIANEAYANILNILNKK